LTKMISTRKSWTLFVYYELFSI